MNRFHAMIVAGVALCSASAARAECPTGSITNVFFGSTICTVPVSSLAADSPYKIDPNDSPDRYYGYVVAQTKGSFTLKDRTALDQAIDAAKSILGITNTYQAVYSVEIDLNNGGVAIPIATIPLVNYYVSNGSLDPSKSQAFTIANGQVGAAFSMRQLSNSSLEVHFKVAITKNLSFSQSQLLNALGAAAVSSTPGGWLANPIALSAVKAAETVATTAIQSQSIITEQVAKLGIGSEDDAQLILIPPIGGTTTTSQLQVTLSLKHKQSFAQIDGAKDHPMGPYPNAANTIILNTGVGIPTTLDTLMGTLGLPVKGVVSGAGGAAVLGAGGVSPKVAMEAACSAIEDAFDNSQFIGLSRFDIENIKFNYVTSQVPAAGTFDSASYPSKCISSIWKEYGFPTYSPLPPGFVVSVDGARTHLAQLNLAMSNATSIARAAGLALIKSDDFELKSPRLLFPNTADVQNRFSCSDMKGEKCFAGHEAFESIRICRIGPAFKNGHGNAYGDSDVDMSGSANTPSVSAHIIIEGAKAPNTIRVVLDANQNFKEIAISQIRNDEIQLGPGPGGTQTWVTADPSFLSPAEVTDIANGALQCH